MFLGMKTWVFISNDWEPSIGDDNKLKPGAKELGRDLNLLLYF